MQPDLSLKSQIRCGRFAGMKELKEKVMESLIHPTEQPVVRQLTSTPHVREEVRDHHPSPIIELRRSSI